MLTGVVSGRISNRGSCKQLRVCIVLALIFLILVGQSNSSFSSFLKIKCLNASGSESDFYNQAEPNSAKGVLNNLDSGSFQPTRMIVYTASGRREAIDIPRGIGAMSSISLNGSTTMFFNDIRGGDKLDIALRNCTLLSRQGYIKDGKIRVIILIGVSKGNDMFKIDFISTSDVELFSQELQQLNCRILSIHSAFSLLTAELPYENVYELAQKGFVAHMFLDKKHTVQLAESVPIIKPPERWRQIEMNFGFKINGSGKKIAVLDTGIDKNHPDLNDLDDNANTYDPKVVAEACFTDEMHTWDGFGHGTHCASIAAGTGEASGYKYVGVAPAAFLLNGKVLQDSGWGYESWIISGIQWAVNNSADVVSMSFGQDLNGDGTDPISMAVDWAMMQGAVCVVAAGNSGYGRMFTVGSPAVSREAITVGATTKVDEMAYFSSEGPTSDYRLKPDVCAPGVDITAARANGTSMGTPMNDYYTTASGTSMATPHVAGAAALILQAHPNWNPAMIKSAVMGNAKMLSNEHLWNQGAGRIGVCEAINTTLLAVRPSVSFGRYTGHALTTTITLMNIANISTSINLSTTTFCEGNKTGYVNTNTNSFVISPHSNTTITLQIGPLDNQAPEGWYEGWLNISTVQGYMQTPYLFAALSTVTTYVYDVDNITGIETGVILATYPNMSLVDFAETRLMPSAKYGGARFLIKSGNYSVMAQRAWLYNGSWPEDFARMFMLQKMFSVSKFSVMDISLSLADARIRHVSTVDSEGKDLAVHSYTQYFCGGLQAPTADPSFNSSEWAMGSGWFGYDLNVSKLTLYSTTYTPRDKLCEALGYYASDRLQSEVYLLPFKFWNVSSLPNEIFYQASDLAKYNLFYNMPETYPEKGLNIMNAFWFTWDHIGSDQGWGWDIHSVGSGINATYYLAPQVGTYFGTYMPTYEGWRDPQWGPLEDWRLGRHFPYPQIPLERGERGSMILGNYSFGPYQPALKVEVSRLGAYCQVNLAGDIWNNLSWPHWQWRMYYPLQGPQSPYPQYYAEYQVQVDGTLFEEGELNGKRGSEGEPYVNYSEGGFFDVDWQGIHKTWNVAGSNVLLQLMLPSMATIAGYTVYNMSFSLNGGDLTPPILTGLSHPLNYTPGENLHVNFTAYDVGSGIKSHSLKYSFDNGTTWKDASFQKTFYNVPCSEAESLAILLNVTDNAGNSLQYFSSPIALCKKVILNLPARVAALPGKPRDISGNLTGIDGTGITGIGVSMFGGEKSYAVTDKNGSFKFTLMAPNVTGDYFLRIVSPPVGVFNSQEASILLRVHRVDQMPVAVFDFLPEKPRATEMVTFSATQSYSLEGNITTFEWDFDDGTMSTVTVSTIDHTYQSPGKYNVTLEVTDSNGLWNSTTRMMTVTFATDLDRDGRVNIMDIGIVARAFGTRPGDKRWDALADIDKNGEINIIDLNNVARDFGKRAWS